LVSRRGVPDDAVISIRSGAVRRQGVVSTDKPFRFPSSSSENDCVVKVDIMQNIGSGYLVMRPNQAEGKQYEVVMGSNADMVCDLMVKPVDGERPSVPEEDATAAAKTKQAAKAYLEATGLLQFVQGVLQVVAKQQPEDPFAAMAKHFLSASDEAVPPQAGSPKAAPTSPKAVPASPKAETTEDAATPAVAADEAAPTEEAAASPKAADAEAAAPAPEGEEKVPSAQEQTEAAQEAEVEKAESDHIDDHKSDTLEEFTSTLQDGVAEDAAQGTGTAEDEADAKAEDEVREEKAAE